jgi:23S rRNA (cytosine1962-C5)-methyltransferase
MGPGAPEAHVRRDTRLGAGIKTLRLKRKEDRRLRRGHPWAFSNEIETPLSGLTPGEIVELADFAGNTVGVGYVNPHSLIAVRLLSRTKEDIGYPLIRERIASARALREKFYPGRGSYRAVYSESDFLPGLVVDRYGGWLAVQVLTAGMDRLTGDVLDALTEIYRPEGVVLRNDSRLRSLEGLPAEKRVVTGDFTGPVEVELAGLRFKVDLMEGQKTGFFLDQVDNYSLLRGVSEGASVIDICCHTGAWGLSALKAGAKSVLGVDSSEAALALAKENARINGFGGAADFMKEDAFDALKGFLDRGMRFGLVVVDPPAFIKSKARLAEGLKGYRDLNVRALKTVEPGGWLVSSSCSHHLDREGFLEMLHASAHGAGRTVRVIEIRSQSKDHPVLLAARETEYLKCALLQVM